MNEWVWGDHRSALAVHQRTEQLLATIQPNKQSEFRRLTIANHVIGLIKNCFEAGQVEAFMFGSVPLRTYLPDGDIDISVFKGDSSSGGGASPFDLRDTWATQLLKALEAEQQRPDVPFKIRDLHIIQAEVKLVKCVVADLVVDVSFESIGGLCTVAFLESIDRKIGRAHLFKRSIVLVKAWCYYESRLLGAHHGLISSYALETLVLYVFSLYHKELNTPLEVLCKFLEVFSIFNWDEYCLSLQGPIPLNTFPNPVVDIHGIDMSSVLLDSVFLDDVLAKYSVQPAKGATPNPAQFPLKYLNIMDPLLPSNNLGRSVSKASFARIRRAFAHGAHTLRKILKKDPAGAIEGIDLFFKNSWQSPLRMAADNQAFMHRLGLGGFPYPMALAPAYSTSLHNRAPDLTGLVHQAHHPAGAQPVQQHQQSGVRPDMMGQAPAHPLQKSQKLHASAPVHVPLSVTLDAGQACQQRQQTTHTLQQHQQQGILYAGASAHATARSHYEVLSHSLHLLHLQHGEQASPGGSLQHAALNGRPSTAPLLLPHVQRQDMQLAQLRYAGAEEQIDGSPEVLAQSCSGGTGSHSVPLSPSVSKPSAASFDGHRRAVSDAVSLSAHENSRANHSSMTMAKHSSARPIVGSGLQQRGGPLSHAQFPDSSSEADAAGLAETASGIESMVGSQPQMPACEPPLSQAAGQPVGMRPLRATKGPLSEEAISAILAGAKQVAAAPNTPNTPAAGAATATSIASVAVPTQAASSMQPRPPALHAMQQPAFSGRGGMPGPATAHMAQHGKLLSTLSPYQLQLLAVQPHLMNSFHAIQAETAQAGPPVWYARHPAAAGMPAEEGQSGPSPTPYVTHQAVRQHQQPALRFPGMLGSLREQQHSPTLSHSDSGGLASGPSGDIFTGDLQSLSQNLNTARSCQLQEPGTPGSGTSVAQDSPHAVVAAIQGSPASENHGKLQGERQGKRTEQEVGGAKVATPMSPAEPALPATAPCVEHAGGSAPPADEVETVKLVLPAVRTCSMLHVPPQPPEHPHPASPSAAPSSSRSTPRAAPPRLAPLGSPTNPPSAERALQQKKAEAASPARSVASSTAPMGGSAASTPTSHRVGERPPLGRPPSSGNSTPTGYAAVPASRRSWSDVAASSSSRPARSTAGTAGQLPFQQKQTMSPVHQAQLSPKGQQQPLPPRRGGGEPPLPLQERFLARLGEGKAGSVGGGPGRRGGSSAAGGSSRAASDVGSDHGGTPRAVGIPGASSGGRRSGSSLRVDGNPPQQPAVWSLAVEEFPSLAGAVPSAAASPARIAPAGVWRAKRDQSGHT